MEVRPAIMALLVSTSQAMNSGFCHRSLHRPFERIDRAYDQHRCATVPAHLSQHTLAILGGAWLERPGSVRTDLSRYAQLPQYGPRLFIAGDDQRILAVAAAHLGEQRVHMASFCAIPHGKLIFHGGDTERADHHRGEGVGELTLEHGAFA